jgi:hypothetical protein
MKNVLTIKLNHAQMHLLTTQLSREIDRLEGVDDTIDVLLASDWGNNAEREWVSICTSSIDSAQVAAYEKLTALKHLLKTIESTSKHKLAWNNDTQSMEVQS